MDGQLRAISATRTPAELWRLIRGYFRAYGFRALAYFAANRGGPSGGRKGFNVFHYGFPKDITRTYFEEGLGEHDPIPGLALSLGKPLRWSEIWHVIEPDEKALHYHERMQALELGDGYSLPVYGPSGRNATLAVGRPVDDGAFDHHSVDEMHLLAQAAHMHLCQLLPDRPLPKPLSARELEILDWVARGKSNSVIADILDLSGATVDTYLRRIYDKLDVSDRTSAAVRGVGMGLIAA
jgi:DNA-binding CsgD family transcriptional regulator